MLIDCTNLIYINKLIIHILYLLIRYFSQSFEYIYNNTRIRVHCTLSIKNE